jgi:pimeloyl-ACP methyl ester carboxylesterase
VKELTVKLFYNLRGSGDPIVLIHGAFDSHRWWDPIRDQLSQKYMIVTIDVRGHGESTKLKKPASVARFSEDLHYVIEELDINNPVLVGHSMGGMIALQYTLDHPTNVKAQVLIATTPYVGKISIRRQLPYYLSKVKLVNFETIHEDRLRKTFHPSTPQATIEFAVKEEMKHVKDYMKIIKSIEHFDVTSQLERINQPSLILVGDKESVLPERSQLLHAKIPNSRLKIMEGHDHNLIIDIPKRIVEEIIEFLNEIG